MRKILRSKYIFDGENSPFKGYIAFEGDTIKEIEKDWSYQHLVDEHTNVLEYDDYFIMPGIHDNHVFFSGYLSMHAGIDLTEANSELEALEQIEAALEQAEDVPIYAYGWSPQAFGTLPTEESLNQLHYDGPITAIAKDRSYCWMNQQAKQRYGFDETETSAESRFRLIKEMLANEDLLQTVYQKFEQLLLSRGVVSIKEIVFDDAEFLKKINTRKLATHFYIQSVERPISTTLVEQYKAEDFPVKVAFGGVKIMVDGVVADETGDITGEYASGKKGPEIDYQFIANEVDKWNQKGIPCCLTTEGDRAGLKAAKMLSHFGKRLPKDVWNSISDLEMITQEMTQEMVEGRVVAEIYPQILGLNPSYQEAYMPEIIAGAEGAFFNYQLLRSADIQVTSGTDLPLFITNLPESIMRACFRRFPKGQETWQYEKGLSVLELLQSFTKNGFLVNGEERYGVLQPGKSATFAIFDRDLTQGDYEEVAAAETIMTYIDGSVVYEKVLP
ncbi:amidohydrolase family protein [Enterococcus sp. AZ196]|uniref:amidohydrolase family protein n=1 Tax=Enterococcus sp. AZ196 TaxID=2774659 RepID=UPI003D2DABD9